MVQIELTHISIKGGAVNCNVDRFFNCSGKAIVLPSYFLEFILCSVVASIVTVFVYRGRFL